MTLRNTEKNTHRHVGLLVVVHRLDKKNEITKVITHCKTGKNNPLLQH